MLAEAHDDEWLAGESNPMQRHCHLARAFLRIGKPDEALAVLRKKEWMHMGSFFERYVIQAVREGHLDHALTIADLYVEARGKGVDFGPIEAISEGLRKAERHDDALGFLAKQKGYSTAMYEARIRADLGGGDPAKARASLIAKAKASTWPPEIARCLRDLTRDGMGADSGDMDVVAGLLENLLTAMTGGKMHRRAVPEMSEALGEALARIGLGPQAETMLAGFQSDEERLALYRGVVRGAPAGDAYGAKSLETALGVRPRTRDPQARAGAGGPGDRRAGARPGAGRRHPRGDPRGHERAARRRPPLRALGRHAAAARRR